MTTFSMADARNDEKNLWVSWDEYHRLIEMLALAVHDSGWTFDKILCLARGGLRVGDQLSRIYDLPLAILATSSYREAAGTQQGELDIAQYITMTRGELSGNVLLVDDLVDSGVTLARVQQHLKERYPSVTAVRSDASSVPSTYSAARRSASSRVTMFMPPTRSARGRPSARSGRAAPRS